MEMAFADFLMSLDGREYNDRELLANLTTFPEIYMRKSGKPVALVACRKKAMVCLDGSWGSDTITQLDIYAEMKGRYMHYIFASKPLFLIGNECFHYSEQEFESRKAMANGKRFMYSLNVMLSERISSAFYGIGDTKYLIENTANIWKEEIA